MNVKELKQILKELPDDLEIVKGERTFSDKGGPSIYLVLKNARINNLERSVSGNYSRPTFDSANKARVLEMVYD